MLTVTLTYCTLRLCKITNSDGGVVRQLIMKAKTTLLTHSSAGSAPLLIVYLFALSD